MGDEREFKIKITTSADASGAQKTAAELAKITEKTAESAKGAEKAELSHRSFHAALRLVGQGSKEAEIALSILSGVTMGSMLFVVQGVSLAVSALMDHFAKLKERAVEASRATLAFWEATLQQSVEGRKAAADYVESLVNIAKGLNTVADRERGLETVLDTVLKKRLEIMAAEETAELAAAKGDQAEEARIRARYGQKKSELELENQAIGIQNKRIQLTQQENEAEARRLAYEAAERAKEAGAPGRAEATQTEAIIPKLKDELARIGAERMAPEALEALQAEVERRAGEASYAQGAYGPVLTAAGSARGRLASALKTEEEFEAWQQSIEELTDQVDDFKSATERLTKAAAAAESDYRSAVKGADTMRQGLRTAEDVYSVNRDAAKTIQTVQDRQIIEGAGGQYSAASQKIMDEVRAMSGTAQGQRMSGADVAYFNGLIAAVRTKDQRAMMQAVIVELRDMHVDEAKKWADLRDAIQQLRKQTRNLSAPP